MNAPFTKLARQLSEWLETRWVGPAYAGWLLAALSVFFFGAASNTMAGWLYVISGVSLALLAVAAILPARSLRPLRVRRRPIEPVSVGDPLTIELEVENPTIHPKTLLQVSDVLPFVLGPPVPHAIEVLPSQGIHVVTDYHPTQRRGVYRWEDVQLRTAAPLGLFWCQRSRTAKATAIVYPQVLPLTACPLVDRMGRENSPEFYDRTRVQMATEGITRTLRPYRYGDPTRLIHWRTSARYGEFRVRELEIFTGSQEFVICLDSAGIWQLEEFEQAVVVAASLYFYASKHLLNVKLWTAGTGLVSSNRGVLETLAAVNAEEAALDTLPRLPVVWLTQNAASLNELPAGSRWIFWPRGSIGQTLTQREFPGLEIRPDEPLELQLQRPVEWV